MYEFYEDVLDRKDIDVIEVATPDHWHALVAIHACQSGKDVYCQKPLAYTITEGLAVACAVRDNNRVFQIGSQQRSSKEFQDAIALVRAGKIGHIERYTPVSANPKPLDLPEMDVPGNLNFNQWMGPLNDPKIHYHPDLCPPISLEPEQNEKLWGHGAGIRKPETDIQPIGGSYVRYCTGGHRYGRIRSSRVYPERI